MKKQEKTVAARDIGNGQQKINYNYTDFFYLLLHYLNIDLSGIILSPYS